MNAKVIKWKKVGPSARRVSLKSKKSDSVRRVTLLAVSRIKGLPDFIRKRKKR